MAIARSRARNHLAALGAATNSASASGPARPQTAAPLIAKIAVPGAPLASFDIGWLDPSTQTYYLADRSNKAVDIIDAKTNSFVGRIEGFVGPSDSNDTAGPNGIEVLPKLKQIWAGKATAP